jgi:hypothetical protein
MAIALTFSQSDSGKIFTITDASTVGSNLAGAVVTVTYDDVVYTITLGAWAVGAHVDVTADLVGQTADTAFLDGIYTVNYVTTAVPAPGVTYNTLLDYNVKYCVYNMLRQVPDVFNANPCKDVNVQRALFMYTFLKSLEFSAACGQVNEIESILAKLQILCLKPTINECYCN